MRTSSIRILAALAFLTAGVAKAQVTQTFGAGSAVTNIQATASFESELALFGNPYVEGGMSFTRTDLTFDNNGCGYAGCTGDANLSSMQGNYMYGNGVGGFFSLFAPTGKLFKGIEFIAANGYFDESMWSVGWSAYLNGMQVGAGTIDTYALGTVLGFSSNAGFDELRYTDLNFVAAPAFDEVHAQFDGTQVVPEPTTWVLMASGLAMVGGVARRKRAAA
jgi:hypothetical protein